MTDTHDRYKKQIQMTDTRDIHKWHIHMTDTKNRYKGHIESTDKQTDTSNTYKQQTQLADTRDRRKGYKEHMQRTHAKYRQIDRHKWQIHRYIWQTMLAYRGCPYTRRLEPENPARPGSGFGAQMLKNTMFFNDLELKCLKTQCFLMIWSSNVEKHNVF